MLCVHVSVRLCERAHVCVCMSRCHLYVTVWLGTFLCKVSQLDPGLVFVRKRRRVSVDG